MVGLVGLATLGLLAAVVLTRSHPAGGLRGVDAAAINQELRGMVGQDGRIRLPPTFLTGSLENTAFMFDLARQSGEPQRETAAVAHLIDISLTSSPTPIWAAYYASLVKQARVAPLGGWDSYVQPNGTYAEHPADADPAYAVLTTWAAISSGAPGAPELTTTLLGYLSDCTLQEYVLAHAVLAISLSAASSERQAMTALTTCAGIRSTADAAIAAPLNEEDLLGLTGRALTLSLLGWPAPSSPSAYRQALAEQDWYWVDPWWAHYSLLGYLAANGDARDYGTTLTRLRACATDGVVPVVSLPQVSLETDLLGTLIAKQTGGPWTGVTAEAVGLLTRSEEAVHWTPTDWVEWGWLAAQTGFELSADDRQRVLATSRQCSTADIATTSARLVWMCRATYQAWAGTKARPSPAAYQGPSGLPASALIEMVALLDYSVDDRVKDAIAEVVASPEGIGTHILAQCLCLIASTPDSRTVDALVQELGHRHPVGSALYAEQRGDGEAVDLWATYWVVRAKIAMS